MASAAARPLVAVQPLEAIWPPMRLLMSLYLTSNLSKNTRQSYAVSKRAGHQTSAESWANVSLVFLAEAPTALATVHLATRAVVAVCMPSLRSAVPYLVLARGHRIESVPETTLVVSDSGEGVEKIATAIKVLKQIGAFPDLEKSKPYSHCFSSPPSGQQSPKPPAENGNAT